MKQARFRRRPRHAEGHHRPLIGSRKAYANPEAAPDLRVPIREIVPRRPSASCRCRCRHLGRLHRYWTWRHRRRERPRRIRIEWAWSAGASSKTTAARSSWSTTATSPASTSPGTSRTHAEALPRAERRQAVDATRVGEVGVITKEMIYVAERENMAARPARPRRMGGQGRRELRRTAPVFITPESALEVGVAARSSRPT